MPDRRVDITADEARAYAAGDLAWATLRSRGVPYEAVLGALGRLGLRPPHAPMTGPNVEARQRGIARLRQHLAEAKR